MEEENGKRKFIRKREREARWFLRRDYNK